MTARKLVNALVGHEGLNFALTNRIPRRWATRIVGRISKSEIPLVRDLSIRIWRMFSDLDLSEAKTQDFKSLHACFIRELRDGARPLDTSPSVLTSPCDGIVVAAGRIEGDALLQVKGSAYTLGDLAGRRGHLDRFKDGVFVTLRLTSTMYHRFHAPFQGTVRRVRYIPGDVWNVNPPALKRVERLYCRNERAVIDFALPSGCEIAIIPVAAILVAGLRLHFLDVSRTVEAADYACASAFDKGQEMGWFEHGSTIIVLAERTWGLAPGVAEGRQMKMGQALMHTAPEPPPGEIVSR